MFDDIFSRLVTIHQKTRIMELPGRERCLMISSAVWLQYTTHERGGQTNRRTDGHRPTANTGAPAGFQARVGNENFFSFAHHGFQFAHPAIRNGCPPCPPYRGGFKGKGLVQSAPSNVLYVCC